MKPYYDHKDITIYNCDCREILPDLPKVDLVLTDPPYGVGLEYVSFDDTIENVSNLVRKVIPICIDKAERVAITCGTHRIHLYPEPTWVLCWFNRAGAGIGPWGFNCWQPVLLYGKDPYAAIKGAPRKDMIEHSEASKKWDHPCPKPERFWKKLMVRCSAKEGETILDPFMGVGTTLRAAKDLSRKAIGIEIEEKYCEIAAERMAQEVLF